MSSAYSFDSDLHDEEMEMEMDFLRERYQEDNRNYDVFLSFRGEDTRASFTSHLYTALHNAGVFVFKDDETLSRGNKISPSLQLAIEESRVSVVVFSRNYAESRWCLKELEKIMECHRTTGQVVVPVFYDVDPSEVRHQTGHFGKAFRNLENRLLKVEEEELQRWWKTLAEAAGISGLSVVRNCNRRREIGDKICLLAQHWREALREAAGILGDSVSEFGKMDIANKIDYFVERWRDGLCVATRIPWRGMLIAEKLIDLLVKHWRETLCEALCEAVGFSDGADLYYREIEMVYKIEPLVVNWSTALGEAAGSISGGAHLNSQGKFANEISLLMKHWREALCEHNGIPLVFLLNFSVEEEIIRDFKDLMMSWKEALREAAGISRVVVLNYRSLVTVDYKNKLGMHDLLRDMGREIIRSKTPMELEERSRLWFHEDALDVLSKETGTKAIEGLALKLPRNNTKCLSTKAFKEMKKLRLLQLAGVQLVGDFKYLSKDLRWLCWHGFPLACIPTNLYQGSLVSIELENSNVNLLWKEAQVMEKLKILNLSHSHYLTQTPDFSNLPNLEKLLLIDCPRLSEISYTIGHLNKVLLINFQDCISLRKLPRSIYKLKSLKALILSGCLKIDKLEEDLEQMESLTTLIADKTAITRVPFSIVRSKRIGYISLCGYEGFSRDVFPSIIWSWMSPTNSLSSRVQTFLDVSSLVSLDVPNSSSNHLSYISKDLPLLQSLCIECGSELQLSIDAANILDALYATNFEELESTAATSQMHNMNVLTLIECNNQVHNLGSKNFRRSLLIQMGTSCQNMTTSDGGGGCLLPGDSYPDWLTFNSEGSSLTFEIPQVNGRNLKKMMCHVHYSSPENITSDGLKNLLVINHTKAIIQLYKRNALVSFEDEEWQGVLSKIEPGNKVQIVVVFWSKLTVHKTTIYLIYEPMNEKIEHSRALNKNVMDSSGEENECVVGTISLQVESIYKPTNDIMEHCHASNKNAIVSSSDENECVVGTISLQVESIYKPTNDIMEHCHASNKNAIVSSSDENACVVRPFSPQVESIDDLRCVSKKGLIKRLLNKFLSCEYFCNANSENKKNQG
ncbi:TMV resistance protein N [Glycine max]|nr:TMV resistance protein N [Glycine max]